MTRGGVPRLVALLLQQQPPMMDSCLVRPQLYTDICKDANDAKGRTRINDNDDSFLHLQHINAPVRLLSALNRTSQEDSDRSNIVVVVVAVVVEVDDL